MRDSCNLSAKYMKSPFSGFDPQTIICFLLAASLHLLSGVSIPQCRFYLILLGSLLRQPHGPSQQVPRSNSLIPKGIDTVLNSLGIHPATKAYVCCPKCFCCYPCSPGDPPFPDLCTHRETRTSRICGRKLRKTRHYNGAEKSVPVRRFIYHDMKHWLARLLCRPDIEKHLERDVLKDACQNGRCRDIWDAPELREFLGPDMQSPFVQPPAGGNEARLIFSLNMDGFNPYQNKEAGKKVSTCAIYMVCLNLPPALRYKMENMYLVGIIPGPHEPSLTEINHLLRPLVDDLITFWDHGVYYSKTALHASGRRVRCAVVPLVCDLPASKQMAGLSSATSGYFCSFCLQHSDNIRNLDYETWEPRSDEEHRKIAERWLLADEIERVAIFEEHGIRYSELLRLLYWRPTRFILPDSMHLFNLGDAPHHCRDIWGMDFDFEDGEGISFDAKEREPLTEKDIRKAHITLRTGTKADVAHLGLPALRHLCRDTKAGPFNVKKRKLLQSLMDYVSIRFPLLGSMS
jgi:hypothetical protein